MAENGSNIRPLKPTRYNLINTSVKLATAGIYAAGVNINQSLKGIQPVDPELYKSKIGTSVYSDLTIPAFSYTDPISGNTYNVPEIKMYSMLIKTAHQKVIVKTYITGLSGSVKEYITSGDNSVTIEGIITGQNGKYPFEEVSALNKLIDAPVAFKVVSSYLQNIDIDTLVIESADINQEEGGYAYQKFTLYCSTDIPVELNIISSSNTN